MKSIFVLLIFINFSFASYSVYFTGIKLGEAKDFETLNEHYLKADVTNSIAKFLLGRDTFIFHDEKFSLKKDKENIKYKKDKNQIIEVLRRAKNNELKPGRITINENKYIDVTFDKSYKFKYVSSGKVKSEGYFIIKNSQIQEFIETKNDIKITKNQE
ncbi:hypothetical protein GCM10012288_06890 [Malaciobacter pacificus]|uniref:Uncharacterized protein n=1 Tax=Malaciobacter pacificus TaxID=1080223 RepID=A0A5C2H4Q3_9BACT|nr:hypothetical protein [Malaciobacter pacificus]QEP33977.1 hypothetical protein APAC_0838 [Malaciobacter pacificus]GGD35606.1 hypothetical protein GCM10012288_06890 [Malaciobacter pacificus]